MSRTWGSAPMLFQTAPQYYPKDIPNLYTRVEAIVDIEVMEIHFPKGYEEVEIFVDLELGDHSYLSEKKSPVNGSIFWGETVSLTTSRPFDLNDKDVLKVTLKTKARGLLHTHTDHLSSCEISLSEVPLHGLLKKKTFLGNHYVFLFIIFFSSSVPRFDNQ